MPSLTVLGPSELPDPGFSRDLLDLVSISGPGMQAALPDADTDFLADDPFARADETPDPRFYSHERLVDHLDGPTRAGSEVARVLKPGAPFVVSFSDRWFPPKAIRLWTGLHPFERLAFVADLLRLSGRLERIETGTLLGLPAPQGQWRPQGRPFAAPLFLVTGYRAATGKVSGGDTGAG